MRPEHLGTLGRQNMIRPSAEGIQPRTSSCELSIHQEDSRERLPVALLASTATALEWLPIVPLHARQVTSGAKYECHENCGYAILGAAEDGYCTNSTWTDYFEGCLQCANTFDIWQYYGDGVTEAADGCNLDATPVTASNSTTNTTTTAGTSGTAGASSTASATGSSSSATSSTDASAANSNQPATIAFALAAVMAATQLL
ncbi:hypothetical protein CABS01_13356 [Colletotrichum abscissum]|uniref:uncharacterized protein n=1 Tax=Colletotrichum abscissum TaxID=1671311 RepID=UPI0027D5F3E6|nr:uncharacterized protein CABS01_13356 [Colletotrichum abscissum]KAK1486139.1 hypothetical protein CABS01_13356 [Colletotrichum abscissum]